MRQSGAVTTAAAAHIEAEMDARRVTPLIARTLLRLAEAGLPLDALTGDDVARAPALLGPVAVLSAPPSAGDFFDAFVLPGRPVVLRGACGDGWAPLRDFRDFGYLRRRCGKRLVNVKALSVCDLKGRRCFVSDPQLQMPLEDYLDAVEASERDGEPCPFYLGKVRQRQGKVQGELSRARKGKERQGQARARSAQVM